MKAGLAVEVFPYLLEEVAKMEDEGFVMTILETIS